ncbi:hypothetical protein BOTBODRAFT_36690 [Botryobasidium botryosum FD-172 SS1]|uniref:SP-RING-type domain-containing protein n=1 Tax=Botryobasidium botryosum (strain FD-172 SS1) TaxID=930990 RepID=A0A067ME84_BOTB1|nr:hypothetical protein BOTBODRAFT_36690 [Botryobasidium botryosum FD-172 SS1]
MPPKGRRSRPAPKPDPEERESSPDEGRGMGDSSSQVKDFLENWRDQPLEASATAKLKGMTGEWKMLEGYVAKAFISITEAAAMIEEMAEEDSEEAQMVDQLDTAFRELIDTKMELSAQNAAIEDIQRAITQRQEISDAMDRYERGVKDRLDKYQAKTSKQKYGKNEEYVKFRQTIWEVRHADEAMPPATQFLPTDEGEDEGSDDDIVVGGVKKSYTCPLTLTPLQKPMTSIKCNHSFSAHAIREYLKSKNGIASCPATGCAHKLTMRDLVEDKELENKIKLMNRRKKRMEEEKDEDDEDEVNESMVVDS